MSDVRRMNDRERKNSGTGSTICEVHERRGMMRKHTSFLHRLSEFLHAVYALEGLSGVDFSSLACRLVREIKFDTGATSHSGNV